MSLWGWLEDAAGAMGRAIGDVVDAMGNIIVSIADLVGKIPIIGGVFHGLLSIVGAPFNALSALIDGKRIDDVVLGQFKDIVSGIREIAPLAQSIISFVPGIGPGINGAIAGAIALANGANLSDALVAAAKNALPGGPITAAAFEATEAAIRGENIFESVGEAALHLLPREAQSALTIIYKTAQGDNIAMAALEELKRYLPPGASIGIDIGVAVGQGRRLQDIVYTTINTLGTEGVATIGEMGLHVINGESAFASAYANMKGGINAISSGAKKSGEAAIAALRGLPGYEWMNHTTAGLLAGGKAQYCQPQWEYTRNGYINRNPHKDEDMCKYGFTIGEMGYASGIAIMDKYGMNEQMISKMRDKMPTPADLATFDAAISTYIGAVMKPQTQAELTALAAAVVIDTSINLEPWKQTASSARLGVVKQKFNQTDPNIRWNLVKQRISGQTVYGSLVTLRNLVKSSPSAEVRMMTNRKVITADYSGYAVNNLSIGESAYYTAWGMRHAAADQRVAMASLMSADTMSNAVAIEVMHQLKRSQGFFKVFTEIGDYVAKFFNPLLAH
jgi:hypothetical protein